MGLLDIRLGCRLIRCSPFLGHPGNCNILENVYAITYIFVLQLSVLLLCNKHLGKFRFKIAPHSVIERDERFMQII